MQSPTADRCRRWWSWYMCGVCMCVRPLICQYAFVCSRACAFGELDDSRFWRPTGWSDISDRWVSIVANGTSHGRMWVKSIFLKCDMVRDGLCADRAVNLWPRGGLNSKSRPKGCHEIALLFVPSSHPKGSWMKPKIHWLTSTAESCLYCGVPARRKNTHSL